MQIKSYLPSNEAAMMLYCSLKGEAEEELEYVDMSKVNSKNGIDFIVESLRTPLMTRSVYLKRRYLHEFEHLSRYNGESIRAYCNRYGRVERSLKAVDIQIEAMYDNEARGSRLLDRMRLSLDQQRLILTSTGQDMDYNKIKEASQIQFPDHRPTPPVIFSREFDFKSDRPPQDSSSKPQQQSKGKGSSKGSSMGKGKRHQTYVAGANDSVPEEQQDGEAVVEDAVAEDQDQPEQEGECEEEEFCEQSDGEEMVDLDAVVDCLTVTARRLQGLTLGRKFTGKRSLADRKRTSHCAICGERGHWQGDPECSGASGSGKGGSKSSSSNAKGAGATSKPFAKGKDGDASRASGSKKVFTVKYADGVTVEQPVQDPPVQEQAFGTYFTFVSYHIQTEVSQVFLSSINEYAGYMVLDTACQRTCCSSTWLESYGLKLNKLRLKIREQPEREPFQFGHGGPQYSFKHAYIPAGLNGDHDGLCLLGVSVLDTKDGNRIPLLASSYLLDDRLKAIIDLPRKLLHSEALGIQIPIVKVDGHLALKIDEFPAHVHESHVWKQLSSEDVWHEPDCELMYPQQFDTFKTTLEGPLRDVSCTSNMASVMATDGEDLPRVRGDLSHVHASSSSAGLQTESMDRTSRCEQRADLRSSAASSSQAMPTSTKHDSEERQSSRKLCEMPRLRKEVGVERPKQHMGRANSFRKTIVAALSLFGELLGGYDALIHGRSSINHDDSNIGKFHEPFFEGGQAQESILQTSEATQFFSEKTGCRDDPASFAGTKSSGTSQSSQAWGRQSGEQGLWLGVQPRARQSGGVLARSGGGTGVRLEPGGGLKSSTWLTGHLRHAQKIYEAEARTYEQIPAHVYITKYDSKIDLLELFSGAARLTDTAYKFNLNAIQPFDLREGIDLSTEGGRKLATHVVKTHKPLLLHVAWPCTVWTLFNENMNYSHRPQELEALREDAREMLKFTASLCKEQQAEGRLFLGESVLKSRLWDEESIQDLWHLPDVDSTTCDAGAYGAESVDGFPIVKPHRWIGNGKFILGRLNQKMTPEQKVFAKPIQGKDTAKSGEYCQGLVNAILQGLLQEARSRNPARFQRSNEVFYVRPSGDVEKWRPILEILENRFVNTYKKTYDLNMKDPLFDQVCALVPWTLERVQIAATPAARRWPAFKIPFTHRGAVLLLADGGIYVESEDLSEVKYPQQRFSRAVRLGIFFYGNAPDESDPDEAGLLVPDGENVWTRQEQQASTIPTTRNGGPAWHTVTRRVTREARTGKVIQDLRDPVHQPNHLVHKKLSEPTDLEVIFFYKPLQEQEVCEKGEDSRSSEIEKSQVSVEHVEKGDGHAPPAALRVPGLKTDVWFEDPPPSLTPQMKTSLARLHCNMGHAPKEEIVRLLAASNALTAKILSGLDALRCGSCLRTSKVQRPPTSSTTSATVGFFGEVLQADLVYHRLLTGKAVPILGVVCEATNYHAAKALKSRQPQEVLETLIEIWYRPLGLPHRFRCDPDGAFQGIVAQWHATHGVLHELIPAELHNRIGKIERRNALMRTLLERLTDEHACADVEHLQHLIVAALFTMNSCTFSFGRSPYQAVFGKIPRPLGDVVNDEKMLVYSPDDVERQYRPEILRADALKALAELVPAMLWNVLCWGKRETPSTFMLYNQVKQWLTGVGLEKHDSWRRALGT